VPKLSRLYLSDLVLLENIASSKGVFLTEDLNANVNQGSGEASIL
jgi:hypothetical protein